jgi:hypothetical protein
LTQYFSEKQTQKGALLHVLVALSVWLRNTSRLVELSKARVSMGSRVAWLGAVILGALFATNANAQTENDKLRGCLTIEDGSKERLDCYDGVVPPDPKPKPPAAKLVADCKFLKEEDERLGCFNRFLVKPPVAAKKGGAKVQPSK